MKIFDIRSVAAALSGVSAIAVTAGLAYAAPVDDKLAEIEANGTYLSGDKHNHTTCTDGAMAVETVVTESLLTYDLDWFAQTGHGGEGSRDCRFDDPEYNGSGSGSGAFWEETVGFDAIEGDVELSGGNREMWRWQSITEYAFPAQRMVGEVADEPTWIGVEHNAPGHEHVDMAILDGQFNRVKENADRVGQFEYLFDRSDDDTSGGNNYEDAANLGIPKPVGPNNGDAETGTSGHAIAVQSVEWLVNNFGRRAYYVPAHVERQGAFVSDANRGWNVEHFRDLHTAGLINPARPDLESIVFGAEMVAGHQFANGGRGTYEPDRPTAGYGTYGGAGAYSAAEVSVPGQDFDGNDLTNATLTTIRDGFNAQFENRLTEPSGSDQYDQLDACNDCSDAAPAGIGTSPRERFVLGRPGVRTMWDALLGEGRKFFNFGSSDWHNRGTFGPFEPQSTLDPWPGEYNKLYAYADGVEKSFSRESAEAIIAGMRTGNSWSVMGDLIDSFTMVMCQSTRCATMGETLNFRPGTGDVEWLIKLRDPEGTNFSPYRFLNPSLRQINMSVRMNEPKLSHIDIIRGDVTGIIAPADAAYTTNVSNPSTEIFATVDNLSNEFTVSGDFLVARGTISEASITNDMYFRVRGTNMPAGTPNETDADGNPLLDDFSSLIPCRARGAGGVETTDAEVVSDAETAINAGRSSFRAANAVDARFDELACPDHLPVDANGVKYMDADVEAWADLWFYANPVFIKVLPPLN